NNSSDLGFQRLHTPGTPDDLAPGLSNPVCPQPQRHRPLALTGFTKYNMIWLSENAHEFLLLNCRGNDAHGRGIAIGRPERVMMPATSRLNLTDDRCAIISHSCARRRPGCER